MSVRKYTEWRNSSLFKLAGGLAEFGTQTMKTVRFKVEFPWLKSPYSYEVPSLMERLGYEENRTKYDKDGDPYYIYTMIQHIKFFDKVPTKDEKTSLKDTYERKLQDALGSLYREWREVEQNPIYIFS